MCITARDIVFFFKEKTGNGVRLSPVGPEVGIRDRLGTDALTPDRTRHFLNPELPQFSKTIPYPWK